MTKAAHISAANIKVATDRGASISTRQPFHVPVRQRPASIGVSRISFRAVLPPASSIQERVSSIQNPPLRFLCCLLWGSPIKVESK